MIDTLSRPKGFTLIELLVVIAILGILAAVVLVAINPAQRIAEANDTSAKSNLSQVATAMEACFTQNTGSYTNCNSATNLRTGGFSKNDIPGVTFGTITGNETVAYATLTATSARAKFNVPGPCASNPYIAYYTTSGRTMLKCGSVPATADTLPAVGAAATATFAAP